MFFFWASISSEPMRRFFSLPTVLYGVSPSAKVVREQRLAPEGELALQIGTRRQDTADQLGDGVE